MLFDAIFFVVWINCWKPLKLMEKKDIIIYEMTEKRQVSLIFSKICGYVEKRPLEKCTLNIEHWTCSDHFYIGQIAAYTYIFRLGVLIGCGIHNVDFWGKICFEPFYTQFQVKTLNIVHLDIKYHLQTIFPVNQPGMCLHTQIRYVPTISVTV